MGSFSMTCSASGLGIAAGTPVRVFLLTESPYTGRGEGEWSIRTPPLRACYNDHGSIERVHPKDKPIADLWLRGFREDLVEAGTGDNPHRDVPVRKKMSFGELLDALRGERVFVRRDTDNFWRRPRKDLVYTSEEHETNARLIPSLQRVEEILERDEALKSQLDGKVTGTGLFCGKFVLDEPRPRLVRVRWEKKASGDGNKKYLPEEETTNEYNQLNKVKRIVNFAGFTSCIISSTDCRKGSLELVVFAAPSCHQFHAGPQWYSGKKEGAGGRDAPLRVSMAMVREDVWQAMCQFPQSDYVHLDCVNCGQESYYHGKRLQCPSKSINKKPFKKHKKGSKYAHGPIFPDSVPHRVVSRSYEETVWYGIEAYKHTVFETWESIVENFREKTPAELRALKKKENPPKKISRTAQAKVAAIIEKFRQDEKKKLAAMSVAERKAYRADQKETLAQWEREKYEKKKNPVFGDFLISDHVTAADERPGSWIFSTRVPGVISLGDHLSMLLADRKQAPQVLLTSIAELAAVTISIRQVRKNWEPATSTGAQSPEWNFHLRQLKMLAQVVESEIKEDNESGYREADDPPLQCAPLKMNEVFSKTE